MSTKTKMPFYILFVMALSWIVYGKMASVMHKKPASIEHINSVMVQNIKPTTHNIDIEATGILKPKGLLRLVAKTGGTIDVVNIKAGDIVAKDTKMIVINDHGKKALLESAEETLKEKTTLYQIHKELSTMGYQAKVSFYEKSSALAAARANYEAAKMNYEDTITYAPINGFVGSVEPDVGDSVNSGTLMVTMFPIEAFKVTIYLSVDDIAKVSKGNDAQIILPNGKIIDGTVTKAEVIAEPSNKMYQVDITAQTEGDVSYPFKMLGSPVRATIKTDSIIGVAVPNSALSMDENGTLGIKIVNEEKKAIFVPVKIERAIKDRFILSSSAFENAIDKKFTVITRGADFVKNGAKVKTVNKEDAEEENGDEA